MSLTPEDPEFFEEEDSLIDDEITQEDIERPLIIAADFDLSEDIVWVDEEDDDPLDDGRDGIAAD